MTTAASAFDAELDSIFSSSFAAPPKSKPIAPPKPAKSATPDNSTASASAQAVPATSKQSQGSSSKSKKRKAPTAKPAPESDAEEVDSEQEELYAARAAAKRLKQSSRDAPAQAFKTAKGAGKAVEPVIQPEDESDENSESEVEEASNEDVDNSIEAELSSDDEAEVAEAPKPQPAAPKLSTEARAEQDSRTVFVGNVPLSTALSRAERKTFTRFVQARLADIQKEQPSLAEVKLGSIRFRSLPLDVSGAKATTSTSAAAPKPQKPIEAHSSRRGQQWRAQGYKKRRSADDDVDEQAAAAPAKVFLSAQQKRKVAFITGGQGKSKEGAEEAEKGGGSCSAYVVFSSADAISSMVAALDGQLFGSRTLRADAVSSSSVKKIDRQEEKRTVFVGGVDHQESEEGLRAWVEQLLIAAKGVTAESYVQRVRMVRDAATGLGKGFAYVLLQDTDCVDELMSIEASKLKLSKRKLRFERCKSNRLQAMKAAGIKPSSVKDKTKDGKKTKSSVSAAAKTKEQVKGKRAEAARPRVAPQPPMSQAQKEAFGKSLASLTKEERKAIKASDPARLARRMDKRQSKRDQVRATKTQEKKSSDLFKTIGKKLDSNDGKKQRSAGKTGKPKRS